MGRHMLRLLKFAMDYPGWHTYASGDRPVADALRRLVALELIEVSRATRQFRVRQPKT